MEKSSASPFRVLFGGLSLIIGFAALVILLRPWIGSMPALVTAIVASFFPMPMLFGLVIKRTGWTLLASGISLVIATTLMLTNAGMHLWYTVMPGDRIAENVHVADARNYAQPILHFVDAHIATTLTGSFYKEGHARYGGLWRFYKQHIVVAPIIDKTWSAQNPITAWAICYSYWHPQRGEETTLPRCLAAWEQPHQQAYRSNENAQEDEEVRQAIADAQQKHGLQSHPDALSLVWAADPTAALATDARAALITIDALLALWVLAVALRWRTFSHPL